MSHTDVRCDSGAVVTCHESRCHEGDYLCYLLSPVTSRRHTKAQFHCRLVEGRDLVPLHCLHLLQCPLALSSQWSLC